VVAKASAAQAVSRRVAFDPAGRAPADAFNLWQGFAVEPKPGDWSLLRDHARNVICGGDEAQFAYLMGWMARMIQHPAEQGEVAVVMRGSEGVGKGILARALICILGQHGLAISNPKHLTGNFNSHLRDCVFLFADEAFFAGDKQSIGVLKSLITEPSIMVEAKYANAVQVPNFLHLMMASNEQWVVPASLEARRYFVLEVSDAHKNDHAYFAAICNQMKNGGHEAMLHDLQHYDLTGFNVRAVPQTKGLEEQRKLSLPIAESWLLDVLMRGFIFESRLGLNKFVRQWFDKVSTDLLFASYEAFATKYRERHPLSRERFGVFMRKMGAKPCRLTDAPVGEHIADASSGSGTTRQAQVLREARPYGFHLGSLDAARSAFTKATGLNVEWEPAEASGLSAESPPDSDREPVEDGLYSFNERETL
jgi:hypothetical protein